MKEDSDERLKLTKLYIPRTNRRHSDEEFNHKRATNSKEPSKSDETTPHFLAGYLLLQSLVFPPKPFR